MVGDIFGKVAVLVGWIVGCGQFWGCFFGMGDRVVTKLVIQCQDLRLGKRIGFGSRAVEPM